VKRTGIRERPSRKGSAKQKAAAIKKQNKPSTRKPKRPAPIDDDDQAMSEDEVEISHQGQAAAVDDAETRAAS